MKININEGKINAFAAVNNCCAFVQNIVHFSYMGMTATKIKC